MFEWATKKLTTAVLVGSVMTGMGAQPAFADPSNPMAYTRLEEEARVRAREKIAPLLEKYCGSLCQLIHVRPEVDEEVPESEDIGFESVMGGSVRNQLFVRKITAEIQIDSRISQANQERLGKIIQIHLAPIGTEVQILWQTVTIPNINGTEFERNTPIPTDVGVERSLKTQLEGRVFKAVGGVIERYCPDACILERVSVDGTLIPAKDGRTLGPTQVVFDESGEWAFRIGAIDVDVTVDDQMSEAGRDQIMNMMRSRTKFASPLNLNVSLASFPEPNSKKVQREQKESDDPYGLERLRQMLTLFRDLAGTKEIITTSQNNSESRITASSDTQSFSKSDSTNSSNTNNSNNSTSSELSRSATNNNNESGSGAYTTEELAAYGAGFILLITLMAIAVMKFAKANRDAAAMVMAPSFGAIRRESAGTGMGDDMAMGMGGEGMAPSAGEGGIARPVVRHQGDVATLMRIKEIKEEMIELFLEHPKVAKDTFARFLKEDGVEETAKYVHVFGHLIVFQLLDDPNFQRELYELSEFYHNSSFSFSAGEELALLSKLKTRCTASEIRVLTRRETEKFDFLQKLDPSQIYHLVKDENMQVQAIVLAQLDPKRRRAVFEMYQGQIKINLMSQLSASEAIPKEFMVNVAKALAKKVNTRPEYDTENLRASDVLLDLLEKASLSEQRQLMATLQKENPDTARSIMVKLVTVEIMPFLKDGHLLELILGMERRDLLAFLAGTGDHIRDLLLRKAPEELADSWLEDLASVGSIDEQTYRISEMKVLNRIRGLANSGTISLLDINSVIFDQQSDKAQFRDEKQPGLALNKNTFIAA